MATRQTTDFPAGGILTDTMLDNEFNEIYTNITDSNIAVGANINISKTTLGNFTPWTDWTPTFTGFSADPTMVFARYTQIGKVCIVTWKGNSNGTKNGSAGLFTMSLPIAPKYDGNNAFLLGFYSSAFQWMAGSWGAGVATLNVGQTAISGTSLTATLTNNFGAGLSVGWSSSYNVITYEVV